jgi:predicted nucleotidyltransferase
LTRTGKNAIFITGDVILEQAIKNQIDAIKNVILEIIPVEQIYLFGSYAYGTPRAESDLDLYVVMKVIL